MFACLFCDGNLTRLCILRRAYILAALLATAAGYLGFFHLVPGSQIFLDNDRVSATFKDPNVYGPFLIFPLLLLIIGLMTRGIRHRRPDHRRGAVRRPVLELLARRLDAFRVVGRRRGGAAVCGHAQTRACATASSLLRDRRRIVGRAAGRRAHLDRFRARHAARARQGDSALRRRAGRPVLVSAAGARPDSRTSRTASARSSSAASSAASSTTSTCRAFWSMAGSAAPPISRWCWSRSRSAFARLSICDPWQYYLIAAYGRLSAKLVEGFIVDTDHWRHFFLLLGLIWGLTAATINFCRRQSYCRSAPMPARPCCRSRLIARSGKRTARRQKLAYPGQRFHRRRARSRHSALCAQSDRRPARRRTCASAWCAHRPFAGKLPRGAALSDRSPGRTDLRCR